MKVFSFLIIVIVAGLLAGVVHGLVNIIVVEPYLDNAIGVENQHLFAEGEAKDNPQFWQQFTDYRIWQKQGSLVAGGMLGIATGSLFGLVFAYSRHMLPGQTNIRKALVLAGIMWAVFFFIPFLKYPANPPTVGDPNTLVFRTVTYVLFVALSSLGAFGFSRVYKKMQSKKFVAFLGYATFMMILFLAMPQNPDKISISMDLVNGFRTMSALTITMTWIVNALILGYLWQRFKPHLESEQKLS